jgi:CHAD domain-containing protein
MSDALPDTSRGNESVENLVTVSLKELLADLFRCWDDAIHRANDDTEHVHQLRVASRRLMAALQLFEKFLPRRKSERLQRELNALRKSAGTARDCDVFAQRLQSGNHQSTAGLVEHLRQVRCDAQQALLQHYEACDRGESLERRATKVLEGMRPGPQDLDPSSTPVGTWSPKRLKSAVRQFFADSKVDGKHLDRLHQFRIRAKQFRYCLELLRPYLPAERYQEAYAGIKNLTQRLGEINDHAAAVDAISNWLESDLDENTQALLRRWQKDERRALRRAVDDFTDWWNPRRRRRLQRRLKAAGKASDLVGQENHE